MVSDIGGLNDLSDPPYVVQQTGLLLNSNSQMYVEMRNTAGDNKSNPKDKALVFAERSSKRAGKGKRKADTTPQTNQQHPGVEEGGEFQEGQAQASNRLEALFLEQVETSLRNNNGAYKQGEWERKPWDVRPYTEVSEYRLPSDVPEPDASIIMSKLDTRLPDNWLSEETQTTLKVHHPNLKTDTSTHVPLRLGVDIEQRNLWGVDCHTRTAVADVLRLTPEMDGGDEAINHFIDRTLLPAANSLGDRGWDMVAALEVVQSSAREMGDKVQETVAETLVKVIHGVDEMPLPDSKDKAKNKTVNVGSKGQVKGMSAGEGEVSRWRLLRADSMSRPGKKRDDPCSTPPTKPSPAGEESTLDPATLRGNFRIHPKVVPPPQIIRHGLSEFLISAVPLATHKGVGVVCIREEGIRGGTFIADYLGEIYPPWRWYERQDALKKLNPRSELPDFYNITLETPASDAGGYDVLFVEAATKSSVASRLSHSCTPNCVNIPTVRGGKHTISMYTSRDIRFGEELCWDYACVTESQKEWTAATCLCGTAGCRGSFLYYAGTEAYAEVLNCRHGFLDRNAVLARAVMEPLEEQDMQRLRRNGIKDSALTTASGEPAPSWLIKWASLITEYIELEEGWIKEWLLASEAFKYTPSAAAIEAQGVKHNRILNVVTTLDKIKYCLRNQAAGLAAPPPLVPMTEAEVCSYLWNREPDSIARRCLAVICKFLFPGVSTKRSKRNTEHTLIQQGLQALVERRIDKADEVSAEFREFSAIVRPLGPEHHAMADLLLLFANTKRWFRSSNIETFRSPPVSFDDDDRVPKSLIEKMGQAEAEKIMCRRYAGQYIWGQLVSWYKQTIYSPEASLSADRRGVMSLPDPESAYGCPTRYAKEERFDLLNMIEKTPNTYFPTKMIWAFQNPSKVYGSPQLDSAIARALKEEDLLPNLIRELREVGPQQQPPAPKKPSAARKKSKR